MTTAEPMTRRATMLGLGAVLLWSGLAAFTTLAGPIPPFQLSAMTFAVGTVVGLLWAKARGQALAALRELPLPALALGIYGLLIFHVCYFFALQRAPAVEASLIIYLWPLLIVLFSGLLPAQVGGKGLAWWHIGGACLGFAGSALILVTKSTSLSLSGTSVGYMMALAAAFVWASYSVLSRIYAAVPSSGVLVSCAATALVSTLLHLILERTVWPASAAAWCAVGVLGLGPVGLAFYLWDEGMKHGDLRLLGVASYATPLVSTLLLTVLGLAAPNRTIWLAALLISAGAWLASRTRSETGAA